MKVWKRCAAAILALGIWGSSICMGLAAGTWNRTEGTWSSSAAEVAAEEYFGEDAKELKLMEQTALLQGEVYESKIPYANGTADRTDLVAVDYRNKVVYARTFTDEGYTWLPEEAVLKADGEEQETLELEQKTCFYEGESYQAAKAFTYTGNDYVVQVKYRLYVSISTEEQERLLQIPYVLGLAVQNLEGTLSNSRTYLKRLGEQLPALVEALQTEEDLSAEYAILKALNQEYEEGGNALALYNLYLDYKKAGSNRLAFAIQRGEEIRLASETLYSQLKTLKTSTNLDKFYDKLYTENYDLYKSMTQFYSSISNLVGTNWNTGSLAYLKDRSNWPILEDGMLDTILKDPSDADAIAKLESSVYALRNTTLTVPTVKQETFLAAEQKVECSITYYEVSVHLTSQTVDQEQVDSTDLDTHTYPTEVLKLLKGTTADEVRAAIEANGVESRALQEWNAISSAYQINSVNYERQESTLPASLNEDITDYTISYTPKTFTVNCDYQWGSKKVPYGYQMLFELHEDEDNSYDYKVKHADGSSESFDQGIYYRVQGDITVSRTAGTAKSEYSVYSILADSDYGLSEEAQAILNSAALNSPTLKIRMPNAAGLGDIEEEGDGYYRLYCKSFKPGLANGMFWTAVSAKIMRGDTCIEEVKPYDNGDIVWNNGNFTHVLITYELKVDHVGTVLNHSDLTDEDILTALNLPDQLVKEVTAQRDVLSGDSENSAKSIYTSISSVKSLLTKSSLNMVYDQMTTEDGRNAVLLLERDENEKSKTKDGGATGGWSQTSSEQVSGTDSGELAFYKYLNLCRLSNWSVSEYYKNRYDLKLGAQATLLADCLEAILADGGCNDLLVQLKRMDDVKTLIKQLHALAENVAGPNDAMDTQSSEFGTLITNILNAEGHTSTYAQANGLYMRTELQKTSENVVVLNISVQVGEKEESISRVYAKDASDDTSRYHVMTKDEAAQIESDIATLTGNVGMTEEKQVYYERSQSQLPKEGEKIYRSGDIQVVFEPRTYKVTIKGVSTKEYLATFRYGSDYSISLPAKSSKKNAGSYYVYTIDGNQRKVDNGTSGSYQFKEEDLQRLFASGAYEITREEVAAASTSSTTSSSKKSSSSSSKKSSSSDSDSSTTTESTDTTTSSDTSSQVSQAKTSADEDTSGEEEDEEFEEDEEDGSSVTMPTSEAVEGTPLQTERTYSKSVLKLAKWVIMLIAVVGSLLLALACAFFRRKRGRRVRQDYDGAPLVDYDIEDDDE